MSRTWLDPLLMRLVDLFLVFPPLLLLLLLISGAGTGTWVLHRNRLVLFPGVARIVRTATLEVVDPAYIEAAVARGEAYRRVMRPARSCRTSRQTILADVGVRFSGCDRARSERQLPRALARSRRQRTGALMIAENREIIATNPWSVFAPALLLALLTDLRQHDRRRLRSEPRTIGGPRSQSGARMSRHDD